VLDHRAFMSRGATHTDATASNRGPSTRKAATEPKPHLLIIDDDLSTLCAFERALALDGYEVTTAKGGHEGTLLLRGSRFDLVVTEHRMPDVTGLELLAEARQLNLASSVIVYTACGSAALEAAVRHLGAAEFVASPADVQCLLRAVHRHLLKRGSSGAEYASDANGPATRRWIQIVVAVARSSSDAATLSEWAKYGNSISTIKKICAVCGVHAGDSLDFARALRIVISHGGKTADWYNLLDIKEPVTMRSFLFRAAFAVDRLVPSIDTFLENQRLITAEVLLRAIRHEFESSAR